MNLDCQWVENNLEAIFSGDIAEDENRLARAHIQSCGVCRKEVQALIAIDPLIKKYFHAQLAKAVRAGHAPVRGITRSRWSLQVAAVALVALFLVVLLRSPQADHVHVQTATAPGVLVD